MIFRQAQLLGTRRALRRRGAAGLLAVMVVTGILELAAVLKGPETLSALGSALRGGAKRIAQEFTTSPDKKGCCSPAGQKSTSSRDSEAAEGCCAAKSAEDEAREGGCSCCSANGGACPMGESCRCRRGTPHQAVSGLFFDVPGCHPADQAAGLFAVVQRVQTSFLLPTLSGALTWRECYVGIAQTNRWNLPAVDLFTPTPPPEA